MTTQSRITGTASRAARNAAADPKPEVRDYHFILTIKKRDGVTASKNGLVAVGPNGTRQQTLNSLGNQLFPDQMPNIGVLFFSLELNQL